MANRSDAGAVVVTGASKGIGRACARRLARLGFRVYAGVRSDVDAEQIRGEGDGRILPIRLDVTDPSAVAAAAERIDAECGAAGLAGLVNNASKHALEAMTDALRVELRPWGIEVVIVEPGVIATPIWETSIRAASQSLEQVPAEALELYADRIDAVRGMVEHNTERGLPADAVARVVAHALTATRPKTRYLVGRDARLRAWLQRLPDRWRDSLIAWRLGREAASRPAARPPVSR
jgi:NAD(P)-dependent dehydrogenase (short-subunit alcohol dehydrogenase family)